MLMLMELYALLDGSQDRRPLCPIKINQKNTSNNFDDFNILKHDAISITK